MNISRTIIIPLGTASAPMIGAGRWAASGAPAGRRVVGMAASVGLHAVVAVAIVTLGVRAVDRTEPSAVEMVFDPAPAPNRTTAPSVTAPEPPAAASVPDAASNVVPAPRPPELPAISPEAPAQPPAPVEAPPVWAEPTPAAAAPPVTTAPPDAVVPAAPPPDVIRAAPEIARPARPARARRAAAHPRAAQPTPQAGPAEPAPTLPSTPAVPLAPVGPPPAASAPQTAAIDPGWRSAVGGWLAAHRRYPEAARTRGQEGVVGVSFTADRDGRVLDVTITRSSGTPLLDQSVRDMLTGQRVPAFPSDMRQAEAVLSVAVRFKLEE